MSEKEMIYIRLKKQLTVDQDTSLMLSELATVIAADDVVDELKCISLPVQFESTYEKTSIIESFHILQKILTLYPNAYVQFLGTTEVLLERKMAEKKYSKWLLLFIWIVLWVGAMMTIINFHYDVNMQEVQQKIHYILTGEHKTNPLTIQIPYAIGLGIGMMLFLHESFFPHKQEEPSPLDIEMYRYQQTRKNYLQMKKNEQKGYK